MADKPLVGAGLGNVGQNGSIYSLAECLIVIQRMYRFGKDSVGTCFHAGVRPLDGSVDFRRGQGDELRRNSGKQGVEAQSI